MRSRASLMEARFIQYAVVVAISSLSACGPSKKAMCEKITAYRLTPADSKADETGMYIRCLAASDDAVRGAYKEVLAREAREKKK